MKTNVHRRINQFSSLRLAEQASSVCSPTAVAAWNSISNSFKFAAEFERSPRQRSVNHVQRDTSGGGEQLSQW